MNFNTFFVISFLVLFQSCYTFSGASIHKNSKTLYIPTFINRSTFINPTIAHAFTLNLQDRFIRRTKLSLVNDQEADLRISGEIISYDISSINIQSIRNTLGQNIETSTQNRLTIRVNVRYESKQEPQNNFEQIFSNYADFEGNRTIDDQLIQFEIIPLLNKRLIDQIFNMIAVNW